ncbi:MAG: M6 family metalloprotease domain-containing protein [Bacteroidetes bacterium]|nr:M6 family metalloprotease domain-containing protein [Bacteroidota bacterium]
MKKVLLIFSLIFAYSITNAAYFEKLPYTITQPNGKTINCFVSGDEFFNWLHDADGYTIIQASNGYYYYAEQDGDLLKPSVYLAEIRNLSLTGLKKWAKISEKEYQRRRETMFAPEKNRKGGPSRAPHIGSLNNIVVYIRFSDNNEFTTSRQTYDNKFNLLTGNSLKAYYKEVSYDNLTINSTHYPACALTTNLSYQDANARGYYEPYNAVSNPIGYTGTTDQRIREHTLLANAINWINSNSAVPSSINIDGDGDGNVDNVCFIIRGNNGAWNDLLWAHRWSLTSQTVFLNGKRVYDYTFQPESQVSVNTLCHEMFHALGAPDLYHYTNQGAISPAGPWDIMDGGNGHMLAYMKWKYTDYSWISSIPEITVTGTYTLNPLTSPTNNCYKIASPNYTGEYFMVEYRNQSGTFESNIPGSGLIVYRINPSIDGNSNGPPDEVYVYRPGGTATTNGNLSNAYFSSTVGRTIMNDTTNPSSFLQNGNTGGLKISNITTAGSTISFDVALPCIQPTSKASLFTVSDLTNNSMTIGWTRGSGDSVLVVARAGSAVNLDPANDLIYSADSVFGNGSQIGTGNYVVYNGTGTSVNVTALTLGTPYYFAIYEYNGAGYCYKIPALTGNATVCNPPTIQATAFTSSSVNNTLTIGWTRGNGTAGVFVVAKIGSPVNAYPVSGNSYLANSAYGSGSEIGTGNYVVYKGTGNTVTINALLAGATYYFAIYEYNTTSSCYALPALVGSEVVCTKPTSQATSFNISAITGNSMITAWTRGNGNSVLVIARKGSAVNENPISGTVYTASAIFGNGSQLGSGNYVVYKGNGTFVNVTALMPETSYYYAVYEYNSASNCFKTPALTGNGITTVLGILENSTNLFNINVFPNPFTDKTTIEYTLKESNNVEFTLYDIAGQKLNVMVNKKQSEGIQSIIIDDTKLRKGIFFYNLKIGDKQQKGKLIRY